MIKVKHSTVINRPLREVFAFVADPENNAKWQEGLVESRLESPGPVVPGAKITDVRSFLRRRVESKLEVIAYEPNREFSLKVISGPLLFAIKQTFESVAGGTRIDIVAEGEPGGFFKLAEGMVKKQLESQLAGDAARLKNGLEG
jgi:carbon monoxide dehydrogenase subunit G